MAARRCRPAGASAGWPLPRCRPRGDWSAATVSTGGLGGHLSVLLSEGGRAPSPAVVREGLRALPPASGGRQWAARARVSLASPQVCDRMCAVGDWSR